MRACRYCSHQNADHLAYCSQCGRRMGPLTTMSPAGDGRAAQGGGLGPSTGAFTLPVAMSRTVLAPLPTTRDATGAPAYANGTAGGGGGGGAVAEGGAGGAAAPSKLGWLAGSIGYIYVYLRGKLDAGERRRRLSEERDGAERLLAGAIKELGLAVLDQGIQHPDLTGLLEAIGRAHARREAAEADIGSSEKLQAAEEARLGAQSTALEAEWAAADRASREADDMIRRVSAESQETATRLARMRDERTRLGRDAEAAEANPDSKQRSAHLRHEAQVLEADEIRLAEQVMRLDAQLEEMRPRGASLRTAAAEARAKLDQAIATRRSAGSAMKASIAGSIRDRADAEREVADLTEQLGRAAAQARSVVPALMPAYQRVDRLQDTLAERGSQIAAIDRSQEHYDQKKLLTGVGLVTSMIALAVAVLWVALR
jgi:hypothetical protein